MKKVIIMSICLCLLFANCVGTAQVVKNNSVVNKDGSVTKTVVTEQCGVNPAKGFLNYWYKALCLEVWEPGYVIPDYPTEYEKAYAEEARRIKEEKYYQWQENEHQRGIEDARKQYGQ